MKKAPELLDEATLLDYVGLPDMFDAFFDIHLAFFDIHFCRAQPLNVMVVSFRKE